MSKPKVFEKPSGLKDFLPDAAKQLRQVERQVLACMERWGYSEIITPTLEFYDTVGIASSTEDRKLFKLLDRNGTMLVLRSDITTPIARVVASLLKEQSFPIRLSYHASVFRAIEAEAGRGAEFYQTGIELVGDASPEADAEVIALAIASLKAAGVNRFKIALGHVGFLNGLFQELLSGRVEDERLLKDCLLNRDYVGYREKLQMLDLAPVDQQRLEGLLRLRGGYEIIDQALLLTTNRLAEQSIKHLSELWNVLDAYEVSEHIVVDLTMVGDFEYYTGMTFEGYAADHGFPVCSGGRYDNLLGQFGRPAPATGFALKTNRILEVVNPEAEHTPQKVLIVYDAEHRMEALQHAGKLRSDRKMMIVETVLANEDMQDALMKLEDGLMLYNHTKYNEVIKYVRGGKDGKLVKGSDAQRSHL